MDKKYFAIDKLSSFMNSGIDSNEEVKQLFIDCGCQCLLDLHIKMDSFSTKHSSDTNLSYLMKFLEKNKTVCKDSVEEITEIEN